MGLAIVVDLLDGVGSHDELIMWEEWLYFLLAIDNMQGLNLEAIRRYACYACYAYSRYKDTAAEWICSEKGKTKGKRKEGTWSSQSWAASLSGSDLVRL